MLGRTAVAGVVLTLTAGVAGALAEPRSGCAGTELQGPAAVMQEYTRVGEDRVLGRVQLQGSEATLACDRDHPADGERVVLGQRLGIVVDFAGAGVLVRGEGVAHATIGDRTFALSGPVRGRGTCDGTDSCDVELEHHATSDGGVQVVTRYGLTTFNGTVTSTWTFRSVRVLAQSTGATSNR